MSFKFISVGTQQEVEAALTEFAESRRPGGDQLGRNLAGALAMHFRNTHVFVPSSLEQTYVVQMEGLYGNGNAPEMRMTVQAFLHQPAAPKPVIPENNPELVSDIARAMEYDEGNPANHPDPTDDNTDARLLEKRKGDALAQTGGVIGDDAHIMEF
jgi:hypothetical protein